MVSKNLFTGLTAFSLILAMTTVVFVLINFGNIIHANRNNPAPAVDSACSEEPLNTCKYGLQHTATQGNALVHYCSTEKRRTGEGCTSACFNTSVSGALVCDSNAICVSDTPAKCLGYCDLAVGNPDENGIDYTHPGCADVFTFKPYFYWNSTGSAINYLSWLFYSDSTFECWFDVCVGYATALTFNAGPSPFDYYPKLNNYLSEDPTYFLDMPNTECIKVHTHQADTNFSTHIMRSIFPAFFVDPESPPNVNPIAQATLIQYTYRCAEFNQAYYVDEDYIIAKRSSLPTRPTVDPHEKLLSMMSGANTQTVQKLMQNPRVPHPKIRELMENVVRSR